MIRSSFRRIGFTVLLCTPPLILCRSLASAAGSDSSSINRPPADHHPQICQGVDTLTGEWGPPYDGLCPPHSAILDLNLPGSQSNFARGSAVKLIGRCCRLPADDILTTETVIADVECPPDSVATGVVEVVVGNGEQLRDRLRCTKINGARYRLGEPSRGSMWGSSRKEYFELTQIMRRDVPAAFRYALGRDDRFRWDEAGCLGLPIGSILVGKHYRFCWGHTFRELQFRGRNGDPQPGTPVQMFPACGDLRDPLAPATDCFREVAP